MASPPPGLPGSPPLPGQDSAFPASLQEDWEPLALLGAGAMGRVYRCRHRREGFLAALKLARVEGDDALRSRMLREARSLAQLRHPGVVQVFAGGILPEGEAYLAMEFLEGEDLSERPPEGDPLPVLLQVADALEAVHQMGLVHRDVKPANILRTPKGRVVLVDFGLVLVENQARLTATGHVAGTPAYLPPEVLQGGVPSAASDWWAWAVTLFFLLERRLPFVEEDFYRLFLDEDLPEVEFRETPETNPARGLLQAMFRTRPEDRVQGARAIRETLARASEEGPAARSDQFSPVSESVPPSSSWRRPLTLLGLVLAVLTGLLLPRGAPDQSAPIPAPPASQPLRTSPWEACQERVEALSGILEGIRSRHPVLFRPFGIAWPRPEVLPHQRAHAMQVSSDPEHPFARDVDQLLSAIQNWLAGLRDWERDHPGAPGVFSDPRTRRLLFQEVVPVLRHLGGDYQVANQALIASATQIVALGRVPPMQAAVDGFRNSSENLSMYLEDWEGHPRELVYLHSELPGQDNLQGIGLGLAPHLDALREELRQAETSEHLEMVLAALLRMLQWDVPRETVPWPQRRELFQALRERIDRPTSPLSGEVRAVFRGCLLVEACRLRRAKDLPREFLRDGAPLDDEALSLLDDFHQASRDMPLLAYQGLWSARMVLQNSSGLYYRSTRPRSLLRAIDELLDEARVPLEIRDLLVAPGRAPVYDLRQRPLSPPEADLLARAAPRMEEIRRVLRAAHPRHRERNRLLTASWFPREVLPLVREHSRLSVLDPEFGLKLHWTALSQGLQRLVTLLGDWAEENPQAPSPERHPVLRPFLDQALIPFLLHLSVDTKILGGMALDRMHPSLGSEELARAHQALEAIRNESRSLLLFLEDLDPLPDFLLPLALSLPREKVWSPDSLKPLLEQSQAALAREEDPDALWLLTNALLETLAFEPMTQALDPSERLRLLDLLEGRVGRQRALDARDQLLLEARILLERARLLRVRPKARRVRKHSLRALRDGLPLVLGHPDCTPRLRVSLLWALSRVLLADGGLLYHPLEPKMERFRDRKILPGLTSGLSRLQAGTEVVEDRDGPAPNFLFPRRHTRFGK